jgi:hypothetical protein
MNTRVVGRAVFTLTVSALLLGGCPFFGLEWEGADDDDGPNDIDGPVLPENVPTTVPDFAAAQFSHPAVIDNPLFPLPPGRTLTYREIDGDEEIVIEVLRGTRAVAGLECRIVRDRVYVGGLLVEDTFDWYAQDDDGNVWYMGEEVTDFHYDEDGNLIDIEHPGVWETLKDVAGTGVLALPGYIMPAAPAVGDRYHQEYYQGAAEDYAEIDAVDLAVILADDTTYTTVKSHDLSTLDANIDSFKYYASGVGVVLEEEPDGVRVELVSISDP